MTTENKWYVAKGRLGMGFYEDFIKSKISKTSQIKFQELLNYDDSVDYYRIQVNNPDDSPVEYTTLWFFDLNLEKGYLPVYIPNVNGSSVLALCSCQLYEDETEYDKEEDEDNCSGYS